MRRRCSHWCRWGITLLLLQPVWSGALPGGAVGVDNDVELQEALHDPGVQHVVLRQNIQLHRQNWLRGPDDFGRPVVSVARNVTISSQPPYNRLDFAFLAPNWLKLASGVQLNISHTILQQSRYGVGMQLDFIAPSPGAVLVLWNSIVIRHLCVDNPEEPQAVAFVPRIPGFPGLQKAHYAPGYCLAANDCHEKVIIYDDFTKLSTSTVDTAAGGHALAMFNVSKVCHAFVSQCKDSSMAESCMQRALDALPNAALTPGRAQAEAEAAQAALAAAQEQRRQRATLGGAIGAGAGACLLLVLLLGLLWRHKRSLQRAGSKMGPLLPVTGMPSAAGAYAPAGLLGSEHAGAPAAVAAPAKDAESVAAERDGSHTTRSSYSSMPLSHLGAPEVQAEQFSNPLGPPSLKDNWELAAWKTNSHSLRRLSGLQAGQQPQQQFGVSDLACTLDSGSHSSPIVSPFSSSKALSSHELILQGTGSSTTQAMLAANRISLGVCIGAGSFGKVYKGKWRGTDVAVKVMQHSQAAAASVANEIDILMSIDHPYIVSAYHFTTWKRRKEPPQHNSDQAAYARQPSCSSDSLSCGGNSFAATGATAGSGMDDQDMQTYIVQELCDGGNLGDYCISQEGRDRKEGQLPTGHAMLRLLFRLREVAEGMRFLHDTARVVHGDLKSSNILLCVAPTAPYGRTAKVGDLGLARIYTAGETHKSTKTLGTVNHMAPELLRFGKASAAADVYSFAILMWELLTGQVAFKGWQWGAILEHVALGEQPGRPPIPEGAPEDYCLLMAACWGHDPGKRPAFQEVLKCINIMITAQQQELIEQAAGASSHSRTITATLSAPPAGLQGGDSHSSAVSTIPTAADLGVTTSTSSAGEWDIVRVGSMRKSSGASTLTSRSSPGVASGVLNSAVAAAAAAAVRSSTPSMSCLSVQSPGHSGQLGGAPQQQPQPSEQQQKQAQQRQQMQRKGQPRQAAVPSVVVQQGPVSGSVVSCSGVLWEDVGDCDRWERPAARIGSETALGHGPQDL